MKVVAVVPHGLEDQSALELTELGAFPSRKFRGGVVFQADKACFYRLHLMARLPFKFLREISSFKCSNPNTLYQGVQKSLPWEKWLVPSKSFRVDVTGFSDSLNHSHFSALQVKNAIIDKQIECFSKRSSIDLNDPDLCIHIHLHKSVATLSFAGSSGSLHRRGYRQAMGDAPLKENLAAGLIRLTSWDASIPLIDPLCGSGTLLIEAVNLALNISPGLNKSFSFENWLDHDDYIWNKENKKAKLMKKNNNSLPKIIGCEINSEVALQAKDNIISAGLEKHIEIQSIHFKDLVVPYKKGVIICNPPYGKRVGKEDNLHKLYSDLGTFVKQNAIGWQLWLLSGNTELTKSLHLKSTRRIPISNGGIDCRWLKYEIY